MKSKEFRMIWLTIISLAGFALRCLSCLWGWPYLLHPDEDYIVDKAVDMITRSSWEAEVLPWPGHFPIKINSILYNRLCWIRYNDIVADTFADHKIFYYIVARLVTCVFGLGMIILAYFISEKIKENTGLLAAFCFAFYPIFIKHSAYATPDVVLACIFMLLIYVSMLFMDKPNDYVFYFMCFLVACGMTTKYPGTLFIMMPIYVAFREGILNKQAKIILKRALQALVVTFLSIMLLGPNLVTNFDQVIVNVIGEAEYEMVGSVGYGFLGNLLFYLDNMSNNAGMLYLILAAIGIIYCIRDKKPYSKLLLLGLIYFVFICTLNIQVERWEMPGYAIFMLLAVLGLEQVYQWLSAVSSIGSKKAGYVVAVIAAVFCINILTGGIKLTAGNVVQENRVRALEYCEANGITTDNALYDGYSPFLLDTGMKIKAVVGEDGKLHNDEAIQYYVISSGTYARYYTDVEKYADIIKRYEAIKSQCILVKEWKENCIYSKISLINAYYKVIETVRFLQGDPSGMTISIYKLS